jgi:glycosyltransferase involved in cell wall biosynthesis
MASSTVQSRIAPPISYKGLSLISCSGRFYAIPTGLDARKDLTRRELSRYPLTLTAPSREQLQALLDEADFSVFRPEPAGEHQGYQLVRYCGRVYGIPRSIGLVDLYEEQARAHHEILSGDTCEQVRERIRNAQQGTSLEFAGALPIFADRFGKHGDHPQFAPARLAPAGYRVVRPPVASHQPESPRTPRRWNPRSWLARLGRIGFATLQAPASLIVNFARFGPRACFVNLIAAARLTASLLLRGSPPLAVLRFIRSRHFRSQLTLSGRADLVFFTSVPYTYSQQPWIVEIEDVTTLLCPFMRNGQAGDNNLAYAGPYFPMVRALLESANCKAIITHMKATARALPVLFQSEAIARKTSYLPLGVEVPSVSASQEEDVHLNLLFTNSWHQDPKSFYIRGGLDVLEAFAILQDRYPHLRLTLRTSLPDCLPERYHRIRENCQVRLISRFLPSEDLNHLLGQAHIYLLPAARIHAVSLLQAMAAGLVVVTSDGWGFDEFVIDQHNGMVVKGRHGKVSWQEEETGVLRENYEPMYTADPLVVQGLVDAVVRLIEDRDLRVRLGQQARADVRQRHNLEQWNQGLKKVLDRIPLGRYGNNSDE